MRGEARATIKMRAPGIEIDPEWEREAEEHRIMARTLAAQFNLVDIKRVPLSPLDEEGDDAELKRWFSKEGAL